MLRLVARTPLLLLVALAGCGDDGGNGSYTPPDVGVAPLDQAFLDAVNAARAEARLCGGDSYEAAPPLAWNDALAQAAYEHTVHMATEPCFSHDESGQDACRDGDPCTRIVALGYAYSTWGENISAGRATVEETVASWLNSPGHCRNIMNPDFTQFGGAHVEGGPYGHYWTQVFGAPGGASTCQ